LIASIRAVDPTIACVKVTASTNKETRAEPVVLLYKRGLIHHVGNSRPFDRLEGEQTTWIPGEGKSPNRIDALVWAATYCMLADSAASKSDGRGFLNLARK
jgi:phage terminase large subunit-like protein